MEQPAPSAKTDLLVDTDRSTAVAAVIGLLLLLIVVLGSLWRVVTAAPVKLGVSWYTAVLLIAVIVLIAETNSRLLRFNIALMGIASASRAAFYLLHVAIPAQMTNAKIMRAVDLIAYTSFLIYGAYWLKGKVRRVPRATS